MTNCALKVGARQKGFTLIEMSIVLVIIGLIIGGILKGQEIIESSRQKNLITQVNAVRAALTTFQDRYRAIPGDYSLATTRISTATGFTNGNGNGVVGTTVSAAASIAAPTNAADGENVNFWVHLFGARLIEGVTATGTAGTTFGENSPLPATAFPGSGLSVIHGTYNDFSADTKQAHWVVVHRGTTSAAAALSPRQMYGLDLKTDDGIPSRGTFRSSLATNCGTSGGTADYAASNDAVGCIAMIDLVQ